MKVTSSKDMDSYIYSSVVLPLKALDIPPLRISSPISHNSRSWTLSIHRETIQDRFPHNYQRDEAQDNAKWLVMLKDGHSSSVVADYEQRHHEVRIFEGGFAIWPSSNILKNRLEEMFLRYTPFTKVRLLKETRTVSAPITQVIGDSYDDSDVDMGDTYDD